MDSCFQLIRDYRFIHPRQRQASPSRLARAAGSRRFHLKERVLNGHNNLQDCTEEQQRRLPEIAEMIAGGELPVPLDWPPSQLEPLMNLVHIASRRRLKSFFARMV